MNSILDAFFTFDFENKINEQLLEIDYVLPKEEVDDYINNLIKINIDSYMCWIKDHILSFEFDKTDVVQFSSFNSATTEICKLVYESGDPGLSYVEIGKLLQNDGIERSVNANTKYGENHSKTAEKLGLMFSLKKRYFLSCIGYRFNELNEKDQQKFLLRLILRTGLFRMTYFFAQNEKIDMRRICSDLKDSTYLRRVSNIRTIFSFLANSEEYDFSDILNKVMF